MEMWRGLRAVTFEVAVVRMPMDILSLKKAYTAWCVFRHLILQERRQTSFASCDVIPDIEDRY